jgi:hypothetical protein
VSKHKHYGAYQGGGHSLFKDMRDAVSRQQCGRTRQAYKKNCRRFVEWTQKSGFSAKAVRADMVAVLNQYSQALQKQGYSPATIHTYLAAPCSALDVSLKGIRKPIRNAGMIGRSRGYGNTQGKKQAEQQRFARSVAFAQAVGIRRAELVHLHGDDYIQDAEGYPCVRVQKGKGGKEQLQRILPQNQEAVAAYFDGSKTFVFDKEELANKIDYHAIRAENARAAYDYYLEQLGKAGAREQLQAELRRRFAEGNPKCSLQKAKRFEKELTDATPYRLRGENCIRALDRGRPIQYDRLALLCVSVFHLSHWRNDVTATDYML